MKYLKISLVWILSTSLLVACKQSTDHRSPIGSQTPATLDRDYTLPELSTLDTTSGAHMGGADTGGGNGHSSTPQEFLEKLHEVKRKVLPRAFYRISRIIEPIIDENIHQPQELISEELRHLFNDVGAGNSHNARGFIEDVRETRWRVVVDGPCFDRQGHPHDASEQEDGRICFSLPRLLRIPSHTLEKELTALAAHEHFHRYNYWDEGVLIQRFFLRTEEFAQFQNFVNPDPTTVDSLMRELARVSLDASSLNRTLDGDAPLLPNKITSISLRRGSSRGDEVANEDSQLDELVEVDLTENSESEDGLSRFVESDMISDTLICSHLGRLSGLISNLYGSRDTGDDEELGEGLMLHPNYWVLSGILSQRVAGAFTFCGFTVDSGYGHKADRIHLDGSYFQRIQTGDRSHLRSVMDEIQSAAAEFLNDTKDYFFAVSKGVGRDPEDIMHTITIENSEGETVNLPETVELEETE